jgi:BirA family transcriptional regulator, biotin operon repressor / biotin---[acetyl-CoA-carboxylase] ligase
MNPLAFSVLRLLSDGEFHSIEQLAWSFKVYPSRISHVLQDIEGIGVVIQKTHDHRYRWQNPINWIDANKILGYLHKVKLNFYFVVLNSVDSTNRFLLDQTFSNNMPLHNIPVVTTELQTQGRGRLGRPWYSGLGDSLTFSLLWRFDCSARRLSGLSLVIGVAIIRALKHLGIEKLALKWPNDVLFGFRKLAGILIELNNDKRTGSAVVIGIGLNVHLSPLIKENIDQPFVDLFAMTGKALNRNLLLAALLTELATVLKDFNHFGFDFFRNEWISYHAYEGKFISLTLPDGSTKKGIVDGVECDGSIRLKVASGKTCSFNSGELTLR